MKQLIRKAKSAIGHPYLLEGAIISTFLGFAFYPGALKDMMRGCGLLFLLNLMFMNYRKSHFNPAVIAMISAFLLLLLINFAVPGDFVHTRSLSYFMAFPGTALALHALTVRKSEKGEIYSSLVYSMVLGAAVLLNAVAFKWFEESGEFGGFYSNPHHLGMFSSVTLPLLFLGFTRLKGLGRLVIAALIVVDLLLLFESNSKVSWLSFAIGSSLPILVFLRGRRRIYAVFGLISISTLSAAVFGIPRIVNNLQFFIAHLGREARWELWAKTWELCQKNTLSEWIIGHGIGSFRFFIREYDFISSGGKPIHFNFPHNGILQILFENGFIGCLIVFGSIIVIVVSLIKFYAALKDENSRYLIITVFSTLLITLVHFMLTKSFYSKYIQYALSIIIGTWLALCDEFRTNQLQPDESLKKY